MPHATGNPQEVSQKRSASLKDKRMAVPPHGSGKVVGGRYEEAQPADPVGGDVPRRGKVAHVLVPLEKAEQPKNGKWCKIDQEFPYSGDRPERSSKDVIWYQLNQVWYRFDSKTGAHQKLVPASSGEPSYV
jgi:hypothetical protein